LSLGVEPELVGAFELPELVSLPLVLSPLVWLFGGLKLGFG